MPQDGLQEGCVRGFILHRKNHMPMPGAHRFAFGEKALDGGHESRACVREAGVRAHLHLEGRILHRGQVLLPSPGEKDPRHVAHGPRPIRVSPFKKTEAPPQHLHPGPYHVPVQYLAVGAHRLGPCLHG